MTALRAPASAGATGTRDDGLAERLHRLLDGAASNAATLVAATIEVPVLDPIAVYAAAVEADLEAALWLRPSEGTAYVGIGRAWAIEPDGPARFGTAEDAWRALVSGARIDGPPTRHGGGPVLMGGLGFTGRRPDPSDGWGPFGSASLVLPDLLLAVTPEGARLTGSLYADHAGPSTAGGLERRWDRLADRARSITPNPWRHCRLSPSSLRARPGGGWSGCSPGRLDAAGSTRSCSPDVSISRRRWSSTSRTRSDGSR